MTVRIETMEEFEALRATMKPTYIESSTRGRVLVPCMSTVLVRRDLIVANAYNPNHVSPDKMQLLEQSIIDNGFCFPIVTIWDADVRKFVVIDGFHRSVIGSADWLDFDYMPVVVLDHDITKRMAATVQFNKARGVHQIDLDADLVRALIEQGLSDEDISQRLGMDLESVHRYKQITGVAELFAKSEYSASWSIVEEPKS